MEVSACYYYLKDHLGDVKMILNASGAVDSYSASLWRLRRHGGCASGANDYYPFGLQMPGRNQAASADGRYKYIGVERDAETGYDAMGPRRYNSWSGRFGQTDPFDDLNPDQSPYSYSHNNPISFLDPSGMLDTSATGTNPTQLPGVVTYASLFVGGIVYFGLDYVEGPVAPFVQPEDAAVAAGASALTTWAIYKLYNEKKPNPEQQKESPKQAKSKFPHKIPSKVGEKPGPGWEWRGKGPEGSSQGSWYNPKTGESLHPDLSHSDPIGPHYDYTDPAGNEYRVSPDGTMSPK